MALRRRLGELNSHIERDLRLAKNEPSDSVEARVHSEQARLFWTQAYLLIGLGIAIAIALMFAQWAVVDHATLVGWLALLLTVSALWGTAALAYSRRGPRPGHDRNWVLGAATAALFYGLTWSTGAFVLFPVDFFSHQAILTVMFAGVSAGAITVLSSISVTGIAFVIPALLPLAYQFALSSHGGAQLILAMLLVFLLTLVMANRHLYSTLRDNIRLRIEKGISEAALHESESRYRLMFNQSPLGVIHYDADGTVLDCNEALLEILGSRHGAMVGSSLIDGAGDAQMASAVRVSLETGWGYYEDTYEPVAGIHTAPLRAFFNAVKDADGNYVGGVGIVEDFTQRKEAERALHEQAYYDPLTRLPNRRLLGDRLEQALTTAQRHDRHGALVFLDVDHFKRINDRLGHTTGDRVLCRVAERLDVTVREEDTVARLSGDEFIVLLREVGENREMAERGARAVCEKIQAALQESIDTPDGQVRLTASLGITLFPQGNATADELLRQSDTAMYRAKREIRGEVRFYEGDTDDAGTPSADLEHDLRFAVERGELELHYQRLLDANEHAIGAEALLRWRHPEHGLVSPDRFIPLAEESGLIISIGRWVLEEACRGLRALDAAGAGGVPISINVSASEFHHAGFARYVEQTLDHLGVDGNRLVIEVTESVLIDRITATIEKMQRLRRRGIRFAVDDFGTGYSSLTYLKRLPVDGVKIDRSFVRDLDSDPADAAIVDGIIAMSQRLDLYVVAEGVETAPQFEHLRASGCGHFQGFYWARPAPLAEAFPGALCEERDRTPEAH